MDRDDTTRRGFEGSSRPAARITPDDVQRKEFGTARVRVGYLMHEVDEFLDEITDTLSTLLAENERLRAQLDASPGGARAATTSPAVPRPAAGADRAAVEAFLQREKAFLQSLGTLVQGHAEELKGMVRSVRASAGAEAPAAPVPAAPASPAPGAGAGAPAAVVSTSAEPGAEHGPVTEVEADDPSGVNVDGSVEREDPDGSEGSEGPIQTEDVDDREGVAAVLDGDDVDTRAIEAIEAEAPIVVEEPEPTGTRRREEPTEGSLRELFWGEE